MSNSPESWPSPGDPTSIFRLDGKVAVVTGASSGLGHRFARVLHAADNDREAYEIGLVENAEGNYDLVFDSWGPGRRLIETCGDDLSKLRQAITACICEREMARENFLSVRSLDAEGNLVIEFER